MSKKEYKEKKEQRTRPKRSRRIVSMVSAILVIAIIVGAVAIYDRVSPPKSYTVYCGVFQYLEFPAQTISGSSTMNVTETMTTAVSYTTTTSIAGQIGSTTSNATTTVNPDGRGAGVETVCKYISSTSLTTTSSSS